MKRFLKSSVAAVSVLSPVAAMAQATGGATNQLTSAALLASVDITQSEAVAVAFAAAIVGVSLTWALIRMGKRGARSL